MATLRRLRLAFVLGGTLLASLELGTRVFFALQLGSAALTYGFGGGSPVHQTARWDKYLETAEKEDMSHPAGGGEYLKYRPHQTGKVTKIKAGENADGTPIWQEVEATINAHGFRGPEFELAKPPDTFRVLTLGASSTFGYRDRDDQTYPHDLEQLLRAEGAPQRTFEVINFGIPHANSEQIRNLFLTEGLALDPDVVTFYEGANDTRELERPLTQRAFLALADYSLLASYATSLALPWLERFSASDVRHHTKGRGEEFVANVAAIERACREHGIRFIAISQQMNAQFLKPEVMRRTSYYEEGQLIRRQLSKGQRVDLFKMQLLIHADINRQLHAWVASQGVPFVDFVATLDLAGRRDLMLSWVHLDPLANEMLAGRLRDKIFALFPGLRRSPVEEPMARTELAPHAERD